MKFDLSPLYANTVGFDRFGSLLDSAMSAERQSAGYPPYDIELVGENKYAITLAVAGFNENEVDVQVEKGILSVRGKKEDAKKDSRYLHRGIATRSFERKFNLADHVEVVNAQMDNGLLKIALLKEIPEAMRPRKIPVSGVTPVIDSETVEAWSPHSVDASGVHYTVVNAVLPNGPPSVARSHFSAQLVRTGENDGTVDYCKNKQLFESHVLKAW